MHIDNQKYGHSQNRNYIGIIIFIFVCLVVSWGCTTSRKTTKTETTVSYPNETQHNKSMTTSTSADQQNRGVVEKSETTTTTDTKAENRGVLGTTFHAIGYIISLPFIIIGGVFRTIFGG